MMANNINDNNRPSLDLEHEIPLTAIVDVNNAKIMIGSTDYAVNSIMDVANNEEIETKLEQSIDIKSVCRICLSSENEMISLLSKFGYNMLADILSSITAIKVKTEGNFPLQVCITCHNEIIHCYKFKEKCCNTNRFLWSILNTQNPIEGCKYQNVSLEKLDKETQTIFEHVTSVKQEEDVEDEIIDQFVKGDCCQETVHITKTEIERDEQEIEYLDEDFYLMEETISKERIKSEDMSIKQTDLKEAFKKNDRKGNIKRKLIICDICCKKFFKRKTLKTHIKQCHSNKNKTKKLFSCGQCKDSFISGSDLYIHSALHIKGNKWTCNNCLKEFTERNRFRRHIRRHMESLRYACEHCDKTFAELCALRRHVRVHTGEKVEKKFTCSQCEKRFCDSTQLSVHMMQHTGERPCACEHCDKTFPSRRLLASHRLVHSEHKQYACSYCDKRFRHKSTRNTHHRTHTGEKPYVCSVCGKTFIQNSNLNLHMRTHTGEKPYTCDVCERKFSSRSSLTCHRRTHTGEKPYSCPVCNKKFARTDLRTHLRQHTGERPFACCACPKKFINAASLRDHQRIHTGEKPYECSICTEKFKRKKCLTKHIRGHARGKKNNESIMIVQQVPLILDNNIIFTKNNINEITNKSESNNSCDNENILTEDIPIEVAGEIQIQEEGNTKNEIVIIDNEQNSTNLRISESSNSENYISNDINDFNLVTVNNSDVNIASPSVLEATTMKLYQLDQSLVQIHTSGGQVTIRKIISKMTANF